MHCRAVSAIRNNNLCDVYSKLCDLLKGPIAFDLPMSFVISNVIQLYCTQPIHSRPVFTNLAR